MQVDAASTYMHGEWIANSGNQFDDRPAFERYPADRAQDVATQTFRCPICIPIRPP